MFVYIRTMKLLKSLSFLSLLSVLLFACKEDKVEGPVANDDQDNSSDQPAMLKIAINNYFGDAALEYDQLKYLNEASNLLSVSRMSYLLSNFELIEEDGSTIALADQYAYINETAGYDSAVLEVPEGTYKGLRFTLGLDSAINHGNPDQWEFGHPLDPITNGLFWGWAGGYVFIALEGKVELAGKEEAFVYHLSRENTHGVVYEFNFDSIESKKGETKEINLIFDVAEMFKNPDLFNLESEDRFLHSTSPAGDKLVRNMKDAIQLK